MKYKNADIIEYAKQLAESGEYSKVCLAHQVNCQNRIGAGVSKPIITAFPKAEEMYHRAFEAYSDKEMFGKMVKVPVAGSLDVVHIFSQINYGNAAKTGKVYTDMGKLTHSVKRLCELYDMVIIPDHIGCGLAGGNWDDFVSAVGGVTNLVAVSKP